MNHVGRLSIVSEGLGSHLTRVLVDVGDRELEIPVKRVEWSIEAGDIARARLSVDVDALMVNLSATQSAYVDDDALRAINHAIVEELARRHDWAARRRPRLKRWLRLRK